MDQSKSAPALNRLVMFSILTVTLAVLASLFIYKWGGAFRTVARIESAGAYNRPPELIATARLPFLLACGARAINYLATVWPALVLGILIAGLVGAFVPPSNVVKLLGSGVVRQQLLGGVVGMPLMLCSCCVAPIFSSVHERGARLSGALAVMLSSPSLNVAALVVTFLLFPRDMASARMGLALFAVLVLPLVIERLARGDVRRNITPDSGCARDGVLPVHPFRVIESWLACSGSIAARTLPSIIPGVFVSGFVAGWLEHPSAHAAPASVVIVLTALFATLIALPTLFEIPFGMLLLASGFPPGAVAAMLFAGPAINLPSLFTLARTASRKVALLAFLGIWATAAAGGVLLELWRR